jgi:hypothetical protein
MPYKSFIFVIPRGLQPPGDLLSHLFRSLFSRAATWRLKTRALPLRAMP